MSTNASFSCDFSNQSQMKNASSFRATEDTSWQHWGAKSTSLSVQHLHCYVMTLQNIWSALYVLKHPLFSRDEITNQHGGQLWPEGLWGGFVTARLPVWLPTPSGKSVRLRRGGNEKHSLQPFQRLLLKCPYVRQRSTKWPGWQFAGNARQLPPNETVRVRGKPPGGQNDEERVSWW